MLLEKSRSTTKSDFISLEKTDDITRHHTHVNLFQDLEDGVAEQKGANKEHEQEKKIENEKYEKQIGYLTYLGQDTNEALGKKSWYDVVPDRSIKGEEVNVKCKIKEDPLVVMKKYEVVAKKADETLRHSQKQIEYKSIVESYGTDSKNFSKDKSRKFPIVSKERDINTIMKHKKKRNKNEKKRCSSPEITDIQDKIEKCKKLELLRNERLKREREERRRTEKLLLKIRGEKDKQKSKSDIFSPRYNSQFNPEIARQNYFKK